MQFFRKVRHPQAFTFDLDDTLFDNHPIMVRADQALQRFLQQQLRLPPLATSYWQQHKRAQLQQRPQLANDMSLLRRATLESGLRQQGLTGSALQQGVSQAFDCYYAERSNFKVTKPVLKVLQVLANRRPLVAITNGNVDIQAIGIADYFNACLRANINQPMKPSPVMFKLAQKKLGVPARDILHIGDNFKCDVLGAHKAGFQSAWYAANRPMNLRQECVSLLPNVQLQQLQDLTWFV